MARPKVPGRNQPPQKRARTIVITEGVALSRATQAKLPPTGVKNTTKGKGPAEQRLAEDSSESMGIYDTHLTTSKSEGEGNSGSNHRYPILVTSTPPPLPAHMVEQVPPVPPVQAPSPRLLNILKAARFRTILEENRLSTNEVVYKKLLPKGKKKASSFAPVDHVMVWGKKVKCNSTDINEVLGCTMNVINYLVDQIQKKNRDDLKGWLAPLISDITPPWIEPGVQIEKKDLNMATRY
uniref:Uncharacterized protein n=1 Tax=Solanum tuberosum TaxID=4113 RepID=M1DRY7_SOLTU